MEHVLPISLAIVSVCDNDRESNLLRSLGYTAYIYSRVSHYQPYLVRSLFTKLASDKTSFQYTTDSTVRHVFFHQEPCIPRPGHRPCLSLERPVDLWLWNYNSLLVNKMVP